MLWAVPGNANHSLPANWRHSEHLRAAAKACGPCGAPLLSWHPILAQVLSILSWGKLNEGYMLLMYDDKDMRQYMIRWGTDQGSSVIKCPRAGMSSVQLLTGLAPQELPCPLKDIHHRLHTPYQQVPPHVFAYI
jgi:hypothetical protein